MGFWLWEEEHPYFTRCATLQKCGTSKLAFCRQVLRNRKIPSHSPKPNAFEALHRKLITENLIPVSLRIVSVQELVRLLS